MVYPKVPESLYLRALSPHFQTSKPERKYGIVNKEVVDERRDVLDKRWIR